MKNLLFALTVVMTVTIAARAQTIESISREERDTLAQIKLIELQADACPIRSSAPLPDDRCTKAEKELADLYAQVVRSPKLVRLITAETVYKYQSLGNSAGNKSAMQISQIVDQQNAKLIPLLVLQNQRVIELLEMLLKKPK